MAQKFKTAIRHDDAEAESSLSTTCNSHYGATQDEGGLDSGGLTGGGRNGRGDEDAGIADTGVVVRRPLRGVRDFAVS